MVAVSMAKRIEKIVVVVDGVCNEGDDGNGVVGAGREVRYEVSGVL